MSGYFDHVSCHNCNAQIDPERIEKVRGKMVCPACGEDLKLTDLFGIKAQFMEDEGVQVSLDDLVPSGDGHFANPWDAPEASAESQGSYQWADQEEMDAYKRGFGPSARSKRSAMDEAMDGGGERGERSRGTGGVADGALPPGAVRARHIDPPKPKRSYGQASQVDDDDWEDVEAVPEPEPERTGRRRFKGPTDFPEAKPEDRAIIRTGGGPDEDYRPHRAPDQDAEGIDDPELQKAAEERAKRKSKRRRF